MPNSKIEIINLALGKLSNGNFITSLDEDNPEARQCLVHWDTAIATVLTEHNWDFARRIARLARLDEDVSLTEWRFHYVYPGDCLHIRRVFCADRPDANGPFRIGIAADGLQKIVMTNQEYAAAEYTMASPPIGGMPAQFVNALAWRLALEIALANKADPAAASSFMQAYAIQLEEAKLRDAREAGPQSRLPGGWLRSRQVLPGETHAMPAQTNNQ